MSPDGNVIFHTGQAESSHSRTWSQRCIHLRMEADETFRQNLTRLRTEQGLSAAELSRRAGLNLRMVTDIEDGRSQSPKMSTVISLARALGADPAEMMGLGRRVRLRDELADYLSRLGEDEQEHLLAALRNLPRAPA